MWCKWANRRTHGSRKCPIIVALLPSHQGAKFHHGRMAIPFSWHHLKLWWTKIRRKAGLSLIQIPGKKNNLLRKKLSYLLIHPFSNNLWYEYPSMWWLLAEVIKNYVAWAKTLYLTVINIMGKGYKIPYILEFKEWRWFIWRSNFVLNWHYDTLGVSVNENYLW